MCKSVNPYYYLDEAAATCYGTTMNQKAIIIGGVGTMIGVAAFTMSLPSSVGDIDEYRRGIQKKSTKGALAAPQSQSNPKSMWAAGNKK